MEKLQISNIKKKDFNYDSINCNENCKNNQTQDYFIPELLLNLKTVGHFAAFCQG